MQYSIMNYKDMAKTLSISYQPDEIP